MTDVDRLPATQYLALEVLAARWRCGERVWTFPNRVRPALAALAAVQLVEFKSAATAGHQLAWLTDEGRRSVLSDSYTLPSTVP